MTHAERGHHFFQARRIQEAAEQFQLGASAGEDPQAAALERWLSYMMAGRFEWAWQESDRVLLNRRRSGETCAHLPEHRRWLWDGTPLQGRSVLVRCFHGLGDTIQFVRFLPQLRKVCREVAFLPQAELRDLIPPVHPWAAPELEIELMEVPHALRTTLVTLPAAVPYLQPGGASRTASERFRLGLVWSSGAWRPERSVPLGMFRFLNDFRDLEVVGLQRGPASLCLPADGPAFHEADWSNSSVLETARTIRGLDLVITTDTMVAHLAGAVGVPVWTLLHWDADWRWMADRDDSPWYPTMRLFRQPSPGNWNDVLRRVRDELPGQQEKVAQDQARGGRHANSAHAPQDL